MNRSLVAVLTVVLAACGRDATTAPSFVLAGSNGAVGGSSAATEMS